MQTVLLVIHLMVVLALVGVVLIQRSEGGGLGIGGGSGFMSARGTANALTRTTAILAGMFFVLSLALAIVARYEAKPTDILDRLPTTNNAGDLLNSLTPEKANENKPADPNAIPLGDDQSNSTPATEDKPAAAATEDKPAAAAEDKPADPITANDNKPAEDKAKTEDKPATQP